MWLRKRVLDLFCVLMFSPIWLPILFMTFFLIILIDRQFPIFTQPRIGFYGKTFNIFKLRTMTSSDTAFDPRSNAGIVLESDTRVTKLGHCLRVMSLDELPQLINVLLGDMSLVGPRPAMQGEMECVGIPPKLVKLRNSVKPGIAGIAQVSGRNSISWKKKIGYDLEYIDRISQTYHMLYDVKIILKSVMVILSLSDVIEPEGRDD